MLYTYAMPLALPGPGFRWLSLSGNRQWWRCCFVTFFYFSGKPRIGTWVRNSCNFILVFGSDCFNGFSLGASSTQRDFGPDNNIYQLQWITTGILVKRNIECASNQYDTQMHIVSVSLKFCRHFICEVSVVYVSSSSVEMRPCSVHVVLVFVHVLFYFQYSHTSVEQIMHGLQSSIVRP